MRKSSFVTFLLLGFVGSATLSNSSDPISYPETRRVDQSDNYHGVIVQDPYRWLEDETSPERAKWIEEQNRLTFSYLEKIPYRARLVERLRELYNYPKYSAPFRRAELYFFYKNDGLQNQDVLYEQKGLRGEPAVLIDPNKFSADGTARLAGLSVSRDARFAAYGISQGGSDWRELHVMEISTHRVLPDTIRWVKFSGIAWQGAGFYYSRFDQPEKGRELTVANENQQVYYHKLGTPQSDDVLIHADKERPDRRFNVTTTEDERFAFLMSSEGARGKQGNALSFRDARAPEKGFRPIVAEIGDYEFTPLDAVGDDLLIETNYKAPNGRVVLVDTRNPAETNWKDILPEKRTALSHASVAGGRLFAIYLEDVASRVFVYKSDGSFEREITLPDLGTATGLEGNRDDKVVFYTFNSFVYPPSIFSYEIATGKTKLFRAPEIRGFRPDRYLTRRVFYHTKDGTRVPMFIVHKKGLEQNGANPTLLYGYGGFNITTWPTFSALRLALLEQGVVYASANLRGGGEYGKSWHDAGTKLRKQNVFDDFIAAAEYLIANRYTSPAKLAIEGRSNGGLLVGAVINQRPELFRVALPGVGVMDMLRFQKFTAGPGWIADYGSSDNPEEFKALYAYSPLHNIRAGVRYPATLVVTADHDDRVVPAHSFKYIATLQEKAAPGNPILIRIETRSGHGASSTAKRLEETADLYAFLLWNLGVAWNGG